MRVFDLSLEADRYALERRLSRGSTPDPRVVRDAKRIVGDVRRRGDAGVAAWTRRLDGIRISAPFAVSARDIDAGWKACAPDLRHAIRRAIRNIERVASRQRPRGFSVDVERGVRVEQRVTPLARVGCYVPGGRYPLPSTLLMTVGAARAAGVPDITVVCPRPVPEVLCAAREAGVTRLLHVGGAQAIAALAYGTASITRVDKIAGPGNAWVAAAKTLVSHDCAIDMHAGPSEIVVCSDSGEPAWIAADLLAQAEHDPRARAWLITTRRRLARRVGADIERLLSAADAGPAPHALADYGGIVVAATRRDALALVNRIAPEHLVCDEDTDVRKFTTAGTVFVGRWSAQASGDYMTGSNHVLPTAGAGRFRGGLSAADFVRTFTVQTVTRAGLRRIGPPAIALAGAEGLTAHAASIRIRL